jgi:hypothetical protein
VTTPIDGHAKPNVKATPPFVQLLEIKHVKKKFSKWMSNQDNTVFLPSGDREDRGF